MYRFYLYILVMSCISCRYNQVDRPKKLLSQKEFENVVYDLALLNSAKNNNYEIWRKHHIFGDSILYQTHHIDSTDLAQNFIYYANQPAVYENIINAVDQRLKKERDSLLKTNNNRKIPIEELKKLQAPH